MATSSTTRRPTAAAISSALRRAGFQRGEPGQVTGYHATDWWGDHGVVQVRRASWSMLPSPASTASLLTQWGEALAERGYLVMFVESFDTFLLVTR